jgi:hypothetical protein
LVVNQLPFKVVVDPSGVNTDITDYVVSIDQCKFQGSGRIRNATIMLEALEGAFITNTNGGNTPALAEFDKVRIEWQDVNENVKAALFEVDTELGQKNEGGTTLPIELKGRERSLQDMKFTGYFEFVTPIDVLSFIVQIYNQNKGSDQPTASIVIDSAEPLLGVTNIYDFSSETTYYDALMHVINRLNQPTESGGVGDFYSLWISDVIGTDAIDINIKVQGERSSGTPTLPTIKSSVTNPMHSLTYRIDVKRGNQIFVRGQPNTGSIPSGFHQFNSIVEEVNNYLDYNSAATYASGQRIIVGGVIYEAIAPVPASTPPPNVTFWVARTFGQVAGSVQYSEWTNNKAVVTKNSCSNPTTAFLTGGFDAPAFPDGNLVVRETFYFRDFVLIRSIDDTAISLDATNKFYLRGQSQNGLYRGFRILVDTSLGDPDGSFGDGVGGINTDRFGRSYEDAMVIYDGDEWIVIKEKEDIDPTDKNIIHCCVLAEGKIYEYNKVNLTGAGKQKLAIRKADVFRGGTGSTFGWVDLSDGSLENDAFHHPKNIEKVNGLLTNEIRANQSIATYLTDSAVKVTFEFSIALGPIVDFFERTFNWISAGVDSLFNLFSDPIEDTIVPTTSELSGLQASSVYDIGWWYALPFPYPLSEFNGISENVGDLYGLGDTPLDMNNKLFGTLDLQNTTFTSQGKVGLNNDQVEDLGGPMTALGFYFNFNIFVGGGNPEPLKGDIPFTVTIYDDLSQVWRADFQYRHLGDTQEIIMPFSSFTVNRPSRNPWAIDTTLINLIHTPELEIRSIFQERRVRLITWQLKTSYDDNERYMPVNTENFMSLAYGLGTFQMEGIIDGLRMIKQPFVSSGIETTRVLNPQTIQAPNTRNLRQLQAIATAEKDRHELKFESYKYVEDIRCDLETEQSVYLEDEDMIKFSDNGPNTRKLVLMSENFTYNADGKHSGALHDIELVKRLDV